jgi:methylated-DNA-[protein]-cysteine S-methyltransferase
MQLKATTTFLETERKPMTEQFIYGYVDSPLGRLCVEGNGTLLTGLYLPEHRHRHGPSPTAARDDDAFAEVREQLDEYFAGSRQTFDVPLRLDGTPFQRRVWQELTRIPFGETITYAELAERVGSSNGFRAVGNANGRNPISIIVPCHRVIGSGGKLTGYAGGVDNKQRLLELERSFLAGGHASHDQTCTSPAMSAAAK